MKEKDKSSIEMQDIKFSQRDPRNSQFDRSVSRLSQSKFLPTDIEYSPQKGGGKLGGLKQFAEQRAIQEQNKIYLMLINKYRKKFQVDSVKEVKIDKLILTEI